MLTRVQGVGSNHSDKTGREDQGEKRRSGKCSVLYATSSNLSRYERVIERKECEKEETVVVKLQPSADQPVRAIQFGRRRQAI